MPLKVLIETTSQVVNTAIPITIISSFITLGNLGTAIGVFGLGGYAVYQWRKVYWQERKNRREEEQTLNTKQNAD